MVKSFACQGCVLAIREKLRLSHVLGIFFLAVLFGIIGIAVYVEHQQAEAEAKKGQTWEKPLHDPPSVPSPWRGPGR